MQVQRIKKGDLVKHRLSGQIGIVTDVVKRNRSISSIWVLVKGERKRWGLFESTSPLLNIQVIEWADNNPTPFDSHS